MTRQEWASRPRRESMAKRLGIRRSEQIRLAADGRCHYCDRKTTHTPGPRRATFDHIKPRKHGGAELDLKNIVLACLRCNARKQAKSKRAFLNGGAS